MEAPRRILEQALKMKPADKYIVIEGLLSSLDTPDRTIDELWATESEKRLSAYKRGKLKTFSFEEVFGKEIAG